MGGLRGLGGADLHAHTTASDGRLAPQELVALAAQVGLEAVAVTDHDTQAGVAPAVEAGRRHGVRVVPGIELNTDWRPGHEVHVLGYFCRPEPLEALLARQVAGRAERMAAMVERLRACGVPVSLERVREIAAGAPLCRPHLARALVEAGVVPDVPTAFGRYLSPGCPGYVPRPKLTPADAVRAVRAAGGVAVLAHPGLVGDDRVLDELLPVGLSGLEAWHSEHGPAEAARYASLAERLGLVATGGSDFHGPGHRGALGGVRVGMDVVRALEGRRASATGGVPGRQAPGGPRPAGGDD